MTILANKYLMSIDDDPIIHRLIAGALGLPSVWFTSGQAFRDRQASQSPAAVFVDISLGNNDCGLDLIPEIRRLWTYTPILVMTSGSDDQAVGQALASGANDFIKKPLNFHELRARYHARSIELMALSGRDCLTLGDLNIDLRLNRLKGLNGETNFLSASDTALLGILIAANGAFVPRDEIKRRIWGDMLVSDNALNKKLQSIGKALHELSTSVLIQYSEEHGIGLSVQGTSLRRAG